MDGELLSVRGKNRRTTIFRIECLTLKQSGLLHPVVIGEVACGNLKNRTEILGRLSSLQQCIVAGKAEAIEFIETNRLYGRGLSWIDLTGTKLWSLDRRLKAIATEFSRPINRVIGLLD